MRSTKNDGLKFPLSMCTECNNKRSQPFDAAYDRFVETLFEHEDEVLADRSFDLRLAFGADWPSMSEDVLRYFVKHICCRLAESLSSMSGKPLIPADAIEFLNDGSAPGHLSCDVWIEPTWLRFHEMGSGNPLWIKSMGIERVHPGPNSRVGSRWNYGWLVFGWEFWGEDAGEHPFEDPIVELPIVASRAVDLEFALMPTTANKDQDEPDEEWRERVTGGGPVAPDGAVSCSPVAQKFLGGALDFEAAIRSRAPDRRDLMVEDPTPAAEIEVIRTAVLCGIARDVWAKCIVDIGEIRSIEVSERLIEPQSLHEAFAAMPELGPEHGWLTVCNDFARMATLKMIEAHDHGVDTEEGFEALMLAATLAGACGAAVGAASEDWPTAWDGICAATSIISRVEPLFAAA